MPKPDLGHRSTAKTAAVVHALDPYGLDADPLERPTPIVADLLHLIVAAERGGLRPARSASWRARLLRTRYPPDLLACWERRLRGWLLFRCGEYRAGD
jgi:hypothetical protein